MKTTTFVSALVFSATPSLATIHHNHMHRDAPGLLRQQPEPAKDKAYTFQGCYTSKADLVQTIVKDGLSSGSCSTACALKSSDVFAMSSTTCYCGNKYPATEDKTKNPTDCSSKCPLYPQEACGGVTADGGSYYSIFNAGRDLEPPVYQNPQKSSSASSTSPESVAVHTAVVTQTQTAEEDTGNKGSGPNVAGIAAGVVAGIVAAAGIVAGIFFYMRKRRNAQIEEEHRRNAAVNAFISGSKPPSTHGGISMTDSRMDPVLAHRRLSDGSIADNEDYSRRILRVRLTLNFCINKPLKLTRSLQVTNA